MDSRRLLLDAIDSLPIALVIHDADDRFVVGNRMVHKMFTFLDLIVNPGEKFEDSMRKIVNLGLIEGGEEEKKEFLERRMRQHTEQKGMLEWKLSDGRWYLIGDRSLSNGGNVNFSIDITEQKQAEDAQARLMHALDNLPISVALYDADERFILSNIKTLEMMGWKTGDIQPGEKFENIVRQNQNIAPEEREAYVQRRLEEFHNHVNTQEHQWSDGRWFSVCARPTANGGTITYRVDITRQKKAEEQYRKLLELTPHGFVELSLSGEMIYTNPGVNRLFGLPPGEMTGKKYWDYFKPSGWSTDEVKKFFQDLLTASQSPTAIIFRAYTADQRLSDIRLDWDYLRDGAGDPTGIVSFVTDITEYKEKERKANTTLQRLAYERPHISIPDSGNDNGTGISSAIFISQSESVKNMFRQARAAAPTDLTVLIEGETGSGKEVLARYIHENSLRGERTLSIINCGALTENLIDSELFGYVKGAFTGATRDRPGIIEVADHGTFFLDEVGELPLSAQVRLLRFLDQGKVRRLGATSEINVDVRILAATHRNLEEEVAAGRFREDLYHRLMVYRIRVPSLRENADDIIPLARHLLHKQNLKNDTPIMLSEAATHALRAYHWPGNVRELVHTIERISITAKLEGINLIEPKHLLITNESQGPMGSILLKDAKKEHIVRVLKSHGGNRKKAAVALGISERSLYRQLKQ